MKVFILLLTQLFFNLIFSTSPECTLKLFCYKSCRFLKLINGKDNTENEITLDNEITDANGKQYTTTFPCQPGDSISFQSHNEDISTDDKIGIICELEISHALDSDNNNINIKYNTTSHGNKFGCSSCVSLSDTSSIEIFGANHYLYGQNSPEATHIDFVFKIPYEYSIENGKTFIDIFNSYQFKFEDLFKSELVDAETDGRIEVKITQLPRCISHPSHNGKLFKGSDEITTTETELSLLSLQDLVTFVPNDEDQYGLYNIKYKIKSMNVVKEDEYEVKFNVCYKFCQTCNQYQSYYPNDFKCISCKHGHFFVDDNTYVNRCYSLEYIQEHYQDYYLPNPLNEPPK